MAPLEAFPAADQQMTRQAHADLQQKLNVLEEVRADLEAEGIKVPGIVVCGDQSAGKSSVLESLTGITFPRSEGTCTRCPAIVRLQPDLNVTEEYAVVSTDSTFPADNSKTVPIAAVGNEILKVTEELAPGMLISDKPIHIKVVRKVDCTFTIIDLPGLTHNAPVGSKQLDVHGVTRDLVNQYIASEDMVILVVIPATSDIQNAEALMLARSHDPEGRRTLGVLTKVDCVSESDDMQRKMSGAYVSLKLGYVAVRNRTPQELAQGVDYQMARQREAHVFSTHTQLRQLDRDRVGVDALLRRITEMQRAAVTKCLPALIKELRTRRIALQTDLADFPEAMQTHSARLMRLSTLLNGVSQQLTQLIEHTHAEQFDSQLNLSARGFEFALKLQRDIWADSPDFLSMESAKSFKAQLKEYRGVTLPDLAGCPIVHQTVRKALEASLPRRSEELTMCLAVLVLRATDTLILNHVGPHYPRLAEELKEEAGRFMQEQQAQADAILTSLIEAEQENMQTLNAYFDAAIGKVRADIREVASSQAQPAGPAPVRALTDLNDCSAEFLNCAARASRAGVPSEDVVVTNLQLICHVYVKIVLKAFVDTAWKQARMLLCIRFQRGFYDRMIRRLADEENTQHLAYLMEEDPDVARRRAQIKLSLQRITEHLPKLESCRA